MTSGAPRALSPIQRAYRFVNRPYYWYRPAQVRLRLRADAHAGEGPRLVRTAWGSRLYCWPDPVGRAVARTGVHDLVVIEALARLAGRGETAIDAGANVGLMSNVLAHTVGEGGRVVAFEPHPVIFEILARNVEHWRATEHIDVIEPRQAAVSSVRGTSPLAVDPETFAHNKGTASLEQSRRTHATDVQTVRLDGEFSSAVGVLKLDVEMHELAALEGARGLLADRLVRDILFEEHEPPPTPVSRLLEATGYELFGVRQGLTGPILCAPSEARERKLWDPPALLATADPQRARQRMRHRGWITLRSGLRTRAD